MNKFKYLIKYKSNIYIVFYIYSMLYRIVYNFNKIL